MSIANAWPCSECGVLCNPMRRNRCFNCYQRMVYREKREGSWTPRQIPDFTDRLLSHRILAPNGCWLFDGCTSSGYGYVRSADGRSITTHRASYEHFVGPIPQGMHLDHLCHNRDLSCPGGECEHRRCFNPGHLAPVTPGENARTSPTTTASKYAARTHCKHGHEFTPENTRWDGRTRVCRACGRMRYRAIRDRAA